MVSLTMMARLVEAVRPEARLLLVGDPDQLASVEAGAVLADLVEGLSSRADAPVATLITAHRFGASIGALASAIRVGDADRALDVLNAGGEHIEWVDTDQPAEHLRRVVVPHALRLREAAVLGDGHAALATLDEHRLLCAHRRGPYGVAYWNRQVERWLTEETDAPLWASWYVGRPVLVTANDYGLRLYNGDIGVTVLRDGALRVVMAGADGQRGVRDQPAGRYRDHARDDHPQESGQSGRRESLCCLPPDGFAAAHPRAAVHRGDPGQDQGAGGRLGRAAARRGRAPGSARHRVEPPSAGLSAPSVTPE